MSVGSNLEYGNSQRLWSEFMEVLQGLVTDASATQAESPRNKICCKVSDTAPQDDTEADIANAIGDFCVHYTAAGVLTAVYVCTGGDLATTCTWTALS
jgi:hypothetical protein